MFSKQENKQIGNELHISVLISYPLFRYLYRFTYKIYLSLLISSNSKGSQKEIFGQLIYNVLLDHRIRGTTSHKPSSKRNRKNIPTVRFNYIDEMKGKSISE